MVIITSQIDSFRASMRTVILIKVVQELILLVEGFHSCDMMG